MRFFWVCKNCVKGKPHGLETRIIIKISTHPIPLDYSIVWTLTLTLTYSMVPNNSAARLFIFKIFFLPTRLIWTYMLIKIQIIFLPTRLLSTIFYFFYLLFMLFIVFFHYNCFNNAIFYVLSSFY